MFPSVLCLLIFIRTALADYQVAVPDANKGFDATADNITIQWQWAPGSPEPQGLTLGDFLLCTVTNLDFKCEYLEQHVEISNIDSHTMSFTKAIAMAGNGLYTVQLTAKDQEYQPQKQVVDYYEGWFHVKGMSGPGTADMGGIPSPFAQGLESTVSWTTYTVPESLSSLMLITTAGYLMPYTWQKGPTRTAPFQSTPGTKVTASTTPSRRFPTSSWSPFKSLIHYKYMPLTTVTPSPVSTAVQHVNFGPTLETTPSGYRPTKILPQLASITPSGSPRRRRRWAD